MKPDTWVKSSRSNGTGGSNCVEVRTASITGDVFVRNSRNPAGEMLAFSPAEWLAFIEGAKAGEFDAG